MFVLTRNSAKRARSSSTESDSSVLLTSPRMMRKKWRQASLSSGDTLLSDSSFDSFSRQTSRESALSDGATLVELGTSYLDEVLMETNQETDMDAFIEKVPQCRATKEVTCQLIKEFNPATKFDTETCIVSGVAFNAKGDILISDSGNRTVKKFDSLGQLKVECTIPESYGCLVEPTGLCTIKTGEIAVADRGAGDIKVFTAQGRFLMSFGRDLKRPCDIVANSQGHVIITDEGSRDIFVYRSLTDKCVIRISKEVNGQKLHQNPQGVTIAKDDNIIVTDYDTGSIFCYNCFGQYILEYSVKDQSQSSVTGGNYDFRDGPFQSNYPAVQPVLRRPLGVANDRENSVLVVDHGHSRVVRLDLRLNSLTKEIIPDRGASNTFTPTRIATSYQGHIALIGEGGQLVKIYKYLKND